MPHRSRPNSTTRAARRRLALLVLAGTVALGGCYQNPDPTGWGAGARKNFVDHCSRDVQGGGGTTTIVQITDRDTCRCIYEKAVETYNLDWDEMREFESAQANAPEGDDPPKVPSALQKALDDCRRAGPTLG